MFSIAETTLILRPGATRDSVIQALHLDPMPLGAGRLFAPEGRRRASLRESALDAATVFHFIVQSVRGLGCHRFRVHSVPGNRPDCGVVEGRTRGLRSRS